MVVKFWVKRKFPFKERTDEEKRHTKEGTEFLTSLIGDVDIVTDWVYFAEIYGSHANDDNDDDKYNDYKFDEAVPQWLQMLHLASCVAGSLSWLCIASDGRVLDWIRRIVRRCVNTVGLVVFYVVFIGPMHLFRWCCVCRHYDYNETMDLAARWDSVASAYYERLQLLNHRLKGGFVTSGGSIALLGILLEDIPQMIITFLIEDTGDNFAPESSSAQLNLMMSSIDILHKLAEAYDARAYKYKYGRRGLLRAYKGHRDGLTSVAALSHKAFVTSSWDHTIKLWNVDTGKCERTFTGHNGLVWDVEVLGGGSGVDGGERTGNFIVSSSSDRTVKVFDVRSGECKVTFVHPTWVYCIAVRGSTILSGSEDGLIRALSTSSGQVTALYAGHTERVIQLAFLKDGGGDDDDYSPSSSTINLTTTPTGTGTVTVTTRRTRFVSVSSDRTARLWDASAAYSASSSNDNSPRRVPAVAALRIFQGHSGLVYAVDSLDGGRFLTGSDDTTVKLWNADQDDDDVEVYFPDQRTDTSVRTFRAHRSTILALKTLPDGDRFLSSCAGRVVRLWSVSRGTCIGSFAGHRKWVYGLDLLPSPPMDMSMSMDHDHEYDSTRTITFFVSVSEDTTAQLWSMEDVLEEGEVNNSNSNRNRSDPRSSTGRASSSGALVHHPTLGCGTCAELDLEERRPIATRKPRKGGKGGGKKGRAGQSSRRHLQLTSSHDQHQPNPETTTDATRTPTTVNVNKTSFSRNKAPLPLQSRYPKQYRQDDDKALRLLNCDSISPRGSM